MGRLALPLIVALCVAAGACQKVQLGLIATTPEGCRVYRIDAHPGWQVVSVCPVGAAIAKAAAR